MENLAVTKANSERALLQQEIASRSKHVSQSQVDDTCSFARAEKMLGREYHGRFLIELLQNASDAWRKIAPVEARSRVRIVLSKDGALLVANEGHAMDAETVIRLLGQIGATSKPKGTAIGHKGIGFKSVLEVTLNPEIYSRSRIASSFDLAVRFDPDSALKSIREASPEWNAMVATVSDASLGSDSLSMVPVLRYPFWVDTLPGDVLELSQSDGGRYNTIIRLPFAQRYAPELGLDFETFVTKMRSSFDDLTDEILLLLGTFDRVTIEDHIAGTMLTIDCGIGKRLLTTSGHISSHDMQIENVSVVRNGEISSRWLLARRDLERDIGLASELAVGIGLSADGTQLWESSAGGHPSSKPFHLFFPTRIASGLPFLLHGYFEVDAGRTSFYGGSAPHNQRLLSGLADLVIDIVHYVANETMVDVSRLADLFGQCSSMPDDPLAADFQRTVLNRLDDIEWVATGDSDNHSRDSLPSRAAPTALLVDARERCNERLRQAFANEYLMVRCGYFYPSLNIGPSGLRFLSERTNQQSHNDSQSDGRLWDALGSLLRPGSAPIWTNDDLGFVALIELLDYLRAEDPSKLKALCDGLRGDESARLLPTVGPIAGHRNRIPPPAPTQGRLRGQLVLARVRDRSEDEVVPPSSLGIAFLPDGLLTTSQLNASGTLLGVRDYTVDTVLDRLDGLEVDDEDAAELSRFIWRFLARERLSEFGLERSMRTAAVFDPKLWFWCVPGRSRGSDNDAQRQVRARALSHMRLPSRSGEWRPAHFLAFGSDWADWLTASPGMRASRDERVSAYRELETMAPGPQHLLAPPADIASLLGPVNLEVAPDNDDSDDGDEDLYERQDRALHAFLLRLGVAEVPPVEAAVDGRSRAPEQRIPWPGGDRTGHITEIESKKGWILKQSTYTHENVHIGEDFRLLWPLTGDPTNVARALSFGASLYASLSRLSAFCTGCHTHTTRYTNEPSERYPSLLAYQIRHHAWVPCSTDGGQIVGTQPNGAWWDSLPPDTPGMRQSPLRFLPLATTDLSSELRDLALIPELRAAPHERINTLLSDLRTKYLEHTLEPDPRSASGARQSFIGLHRMIYERLAAFSPETVAAITADAGVLSEMGSDIQFLPRETVRHDNGDFSTYRRHFVGSVAFVALAKDREHVAKTIGVPRFEVEFSRRDLGDATDVTDLLTPFVGDRVPELLSLLVFHSLGTQTLELGSVQFHDRARRLANLRIFQVDDLVLDASVVGLKVHKSIGEGSGQDLFIEGATTLSPILYHDIRGEGWKERLRRRIAPHLATLAGNPSYAATFQLLLQADSESEREEFLVELGIGDHELDQVRSALGYVSVASRERSAVWFSALLTVLGDTVAPDELDLDDVVERLVRAGLSDGVATTLGDMGGDEEVRSDSGSADALRLLHDHGVDLSELDYALRQLGDRGLIVRSSDHLLRSWAREHGHRIAWVLHNAGMEVEEAKRQDQAWVVPPSLRFELDPLTVQVLADVFSVLESQGLSPDKNALAGLEAASELARLAGIETVDLLDAAVRTLYSDEESATILRQRAASSRRLLLLLAVLMSTGDHDSRATIRTHSDTLDSQIPSAPAKPSELIAWANVTFSSPPGLLDEILVLLDDRLSGAHPTEDSIRRLFLEFGGDDTLFARIKDAVTRPTQERSRELLKRVESDQLARIVLRVPAQLYAEPGPTRAPRSSPRNRITKIHVESDPRKFKRLGDEAEQWALALVIKTLRDLSPDLRTDVIDQLSTFLGQFSGEVVDTARMHAVAACEPGLDEEELVEELSGFLHLSRLSDGFGFDLLGWISPDSDEPPRPLCLEVKSAQGTEFHVSAAEWRRAEELSSDYGFLIVRRGTIGPPTEMDLLIDPANWLTKGLTLTPEGFIADYGVRNT